MSTKLLTLFSFLILLSSCGGSSSEDTETPAAKPLSCAELKAQFETLKGQEVEIKGFCLGSNGTMTGEVYLNMDDKKKIGFGAAPAVVVVFPAEEKATATGVAPESEITIKATVNESKSGSIYVIKPSIL